MLHIGRVTKVEPIQGCHKVTIAYKNGHKIVRFAHNHLENPSKNTVTHAAAQAWLDEPAQLKKRIQSTLQSDIDDAIHKRWVNGLVKNPKLSNADAASMLLGEYPSMNPWGTYESKKTKKAKRDDETLKKQREALMPSIKNDIGVEIGKRKANKKAAAKAEQKSLHKMVKNMTSMNDPWTGYESKATRKANAIAASKKLESEYPSMNPWGAYESKKTKKANKMTSEQKKHLEGQLHSDARDQLINKDIPKLAPNATHKQIEDGIDYLFKIKFKRNPEYTYHRLLMQKEVLKLVADILNKHSTRKEYKQLIKRDFNNDD